MQRDSLPEVSLHKKKKKQNTNGMKELSFSLKTAALLSEHGGAGPWWVNARLMSYSG